VSAPDGMRRGRPRPPAALLGLAAVAVAFFALPLVGLLARTPWTRLPTLLTGEVLLDALQLSLMTSVAATGLSLGLGLPLAWLLARVEIPARRLVRGLVTLPLVLPPVVGGAALLFALGRRGLAGAPLERLTGLVLPFSIWGAILAATFVSMPFLVITVEGALRSLDGRHEEAARTLGARPWTVLRRITLPQIAPSLMSGLLLTWARAFGEFGATLTFAGNLQGRTRTLPLAVYVALESDQDTAVAISLVMVAISLGVLVLLRDRWWGAS